jgi:hypothetical protein
LVPISGQLVATFFSGSAEALLLHLIREEAYSDQELVRLKRLAERKPKGKNRA